MINKNSNQNSIDIGIDTLPMILSIKKFKWGKVTMDNDLTFKDCILSPDGVKSWNWGNYKPKFRHSSGYTLKFVMETIKENPGIDKFIFSLGVDNKINIFEEELFIKKAKFLQSEKAVKLYNKLIYKGQKVFMYLHSTC